MEYIRPSKDDLISLFDRASDSQEWVLDTETNGLDVMGEGAPCWAYWIGLSPLGGSCVLIIRRDEFETWGLREQFNKLHLVGHNMRFDVHALKLQPIHPWKDTMVATYFGHTSGRRSMDYIAKMNGWHNIETPELLKQGKIEMLDEDELFAYLANDCILTSKMAKSININRPEVQFDYRVEMAVANMESRGVRLIEHKLAEVEQLIEVSIRSALNVLDEEGFPPNANPQSSTQVANWLMNNGRKLPQTKSGKPSTNKLLTAFVKPLAERARGGILYPKTNTTRTKTGRFSCDTPNLQQIPKRGVIGDALRRCFTSPRNDGIIACDFSQVELRVAAALAQEPVLLEAFANKRCPHTEVAAKMFGKRVEDVHPLERFKAKAVNFGILNGMGANRLAVELRSDKATANRFLTDYRRNLPTLHEWMEGVWRYAETYNVARTVAGRTRVFSSKEETRPAISVIVQGSAAELIRHALVAADEAGLQPILSIHDEILVGNATDTRATQLKEVMEHAANQAFPDQLGSVSFAADATMGETWGDA
jgi:DNA polymerase I-like protein with 3'-5' exonuclease and polymerase domains